MKVNSKAKILEILKNNSGFVSGELISTQIDISRTAVWKNIKNLINSGYNIITDTKGYKLLQEQDLLLPFEFLEESNLFIYKEVTDSTMSIARDLILSGKSKPWSVVLTESQNAGRGKDGMEFKSPAGGLYFTLIVETKSRLIDVNLYPMAALIAVVESLSELPNMVIEPKWPFEIWSNGVKIAGILHDYEIESNNIKWLNLGIGINTNNLIPRRELLIKIRNRIKDLFENIDLIHNAYISTLNILGKEFLFEMYGQTFLGEVVLIDKLGTISLKTKNGLEFVYIGNSSQKDKI